MSVFSSWPSTSFLPLLYVAFFITVTRNEPHPTPLSLAKAREFISLIHCTQTTLITLYILYHEDILHFLSPSSITHLTNPTNATLPLITTKSPLANALTLYETLYLASDTLILLFASSTQRRLRLAPTYAHLPSHQKRGLNYTHLFTHHSIFLAAFSLLQFYIYHGWERGVLVILLLMLQNASSPFGTVAWYVRNTESLAKKTRLRFGAELAYVVMYAVCRVGLVGWVVVRFAGCVEGRGALEGWGSLKWHCQVGTGLLEGVNLWWLAKVGRRFGREWVWGKR